MITYKHCMTRHIKMIYDILVLHFGDMDVIIHPYLPHEAWVRGLVLRPQPVVPLFLSDCWVAVRRQRSRSGGDCAFKEQSAAVAAPSAPSHGKNRRERETANNNGKQVIVFLLHLLAFLLLW